MRDSAIIYRSFYESIKTLPKKNQAEVWEAICEFSLNFKEIPLTGVSASFFTLIKPQLEANLKRFANGGKAKGKRKQSETVANNNVNNNNNVNVNNNVNENNNNHVHVNENTKAIANTHTRTEMVNVWFEKARSDNFMIEAFTKNANSPPDIYANALTHFFTVARPGEQWKDESDFKRHFISWSKTYHHAIKNQPPAEKPVRIFRG